MPYMKVEGPVGPHCGPLETPAAVSRDLVKLDYESLRNFSDYLQIPNRTAPRPPPDPGRSRAPSPRAPGRPGAQAPMHPGARAPGTWAPGHLHWVLGELDVPGYPGDYPDETRNQMKPTFFVMKIPQTRLIQLFL